MVTNTSNIFKPSLLTIALFAAGMSASLVSAAEEKIQNQTSTPVTAEELAQTNADADTNKATEPTEEVEREGETMIITGYRGSLLRSLDAKRHADTVTEQISADDLGSLPDISIADALTRLPGISAIRTGGKASEINIRGLSGIFVHTTLNGREQVATSGSRSVEFAQYPSELISGATVYKSQKVSLIEGGVAGSVDLQTSNPLDKRDKHSFSANARGMFNDRADEIYDATSEGYRFSFAYQGKYLDDTLGVSLGFARLFQPSVATQFIGFAYNTRRDVDGLANDTDGPEDNPNFEYLSEGFEMQHKGGESTRDGYVATIQWVPTDTFALKADMFLSKFDEEAFARGFRVKFDSSTANIANPVLNGNSVIGADFSRARLNGNTRVELVNDNNTKVDETEAFGVNAEWNLTDQFTLTGDLSRSTATSDFNNGLLWALVSVDSSAASPVLDENVSISYRLNGLDLPDLGFNQDFTNLDQVLLSKYGVYPYQFADELNAMRFDGVYETRNNKIFSSYESGIRYSERQYQNQRSVFQYGSDNTFSSTEGPLQLTNDMVQVVNFQGDFSGFPSYLAIDYDAALNAWFPNGIPQPVTTWGADSNGVINNSTAWSIQQSGRVWEDVLSGYFQANIDAFIMDTAVTGNVGLRIVTTDQSATTLVDVGGDPLRGAQNIVDEVGLINDQYAPGVDGIKYTDYLPQLNLNFTINDNSQIRFAAARVMSRSPINRLAGSTSGRFDEDDGEYHANSTNSPFLKPFLANQYDLSYEYFFSDTDGALVVALFQKDLKNFVQEFTIQDFDFAAHGVILPEYVPGLEPENAEGLPPVRAVNGSFTTAVNNANGGYFRGIEIAYTQIFSNLPDLWSGLGISASYAYTESKIDAIVGLTTTSLGGPTIETSFPGLSDHVLNGAVFWSYEDFETRINMRYRSEFVSTQSAIAVQRTLFDDEMVLDYQASYSIDDNFSVMFQVINITDTPTRSYFGEEAQTGTIQYFGRQFFLGVNYVM
ncbi:MAG: TonB-dependent receptor [Kangiella sp.]|nr:MAG: TonB-dependent receptor [Kangiella sp.]